MSLLNKGLITCVLAGVAATLPAGAEPIGFELTLLSPTPNRNTVPVTVGVQVRNVPIFGTVNDSDSDSTTLSGSALATADIDFAPDGSVLGVNTLGFTGGRVQFDDDMRFNLSYILGVATVDIAVNGLAGMLQTPNPPAPVGPGGSVDLSLHELLINEGSLAAVGGGAAGDVNESFDFSADPLATPLVGSGSLSVQLDSVFNGVGFYTATFSAPFSFSEAIEVDPDVTATVSASGTIVATASFGRILPAPGDVNGDGFTDINDLDYLLARYGDAVPVGTLGDLDGSGQIDAGDLQLTLGNYGAALPPASPAESVVVPEPTTIVLLGLAGLALVRRRRAA